MKSFVAVRTAVIAAVVVVVVGLAGVGWLVHGQDAAGFPKGFDAVEAAPGSHHVVYENAMVRVLQVTLPPAGSAEPMHYHRWPSLFLGYDTGGTTAHIRYHTPGGRVRDVPSVTVPVHKGVWTAEWMAPEPMHSIEVVEDERPGPGAPPGWLRVEFKYAGR